MGIKGDVEIKGDITVKYGGKPNEIDAKTLVRSLGSITTIIEEINNGIAGGAKLDVRVKAPEHGSFILHIGLIPVPVVDLLQYIDLDSVRNVVEVLVGLFILRKHLKGENPEKIDEHGSEVTITTPSGNKVTIDKRTYEFHNSNVTINNSIADNFEALRSDSSIESFDIAAHKEEKTLTVDRADFETMSARSITELPDEKKRIVEELTRLNVIKVVFVKGRKWDFLHRGMKISANIVDEGFWESVLNHGESFVNGDSLEVDLQVTQLFDDEVDAYRNVCYDIVKVRRHIKRPDQGSLGL
ncbi:MAG: hypothetical protein V3T31_03270 [candidate division Zixibacteria bacterium]